MNSKTLIYVALFLDNYQFEKLLNHEDIPKFPADDTLSDDALAAIYSNIENCIDSAQHSAHSNFTWKYAQKYIDEPASEDCGADTLKNDIEKLLAFFIVNDSRARQSAANAIFKLARKGE